MSHAKNHISELVRPAHPSVAHTLAPRFSYSTRQRTSILTIAITLSIMGSQSTRTTSAQVPPSVNVVEYCVDSSAFHFTVDLADVPPDEAAFRIGADGYPFSSPAERFAVNFMASDGTITAAPVVETFGTPPFDRWADGSVSDLTVTSLGGGGWRLEGSYSHGTQPFSPGDNVADTELRSSGDVSELNVPVTACAGQPTSTPTPSPTSTPTLTATATATPSATQAPAALPPTGSEPSSGSGLPLATDAALGLGLLLVGAGGLFFARPRRR